MILTIDDRKLSIYLGEIQTQCLLAKRCGLLYNQNAVSKSPLDEERRLAVVIAIHGVVGAAARISSLIFPNPLQSHLEDNEDTRKFRRSRGRQIKRALNLKSSGLDNKKLRNYLEHYDEKIDDWALDPKERSYIGYAFGSMSNVTGLSQKDVMRHVELDTSKVKLQGQEYDLQELLTEIDRINTLATNAVDIVTQRINSPH